MSSSTALVRKSDMELMPPPPPAKRIKRPPKVLDEDTYTDALSDIIARDFFPGLLENKCLQEYMDAVEAGDDDRIEMAQRKLAEIQTPAGLRRMATPRLEKADGEKDKDGSKKETKFLSMSLDKFQATYTSEDNASFNSLLDRQNEKKREKHLWLWNGNKLPSKQQIAQAKMLKNKEARGLLTDGSKEGSADEDTRKALPDTWKSTPMNQLMFIPDGVEPSSAKDDPKLANLPPKSINHANTRLPDPSISPAVPPSPSLSAIHNAISGHPRAGSSIADGSETPRVRGYGFVFTPSPAYLLASRESTPAATIASTATPAPNPFKIASMSRRELLHHKIVDKTLKNKRAASQARTPVPLAGGATPRATPRAMTPAAQRLLTSVKGRTSSGFGDIFGKKAEEVDPKGRWMPTPKMRGSATPLMKK